jgi:adenylylsulfate reductase, subunit B
MSIKIERDRCQGCNKCLMVCPGNLLYQDESGKAYIRYPKDCWGCTACLKECSSGAIKYFLGPDIGGTGTCLYAVTRTDRLEWHFVKPSGSKEVIEVDRTEANKY